MANALGHSSALFSFVEEHQPGPSPAFSRAHALLAFMTIGTTGSIGRQALAKTSGLGEGSIRTVLRRFQQERYIVVDTLGCHLTTSGKRLYDSMMKKLTSLVPTKGPRLAVGTRQVAILVRSSADSVQTGIEQRDAAIQVGATGATTYVIGNGKFSVPRGSLDCERDFPSQAWSHLRDRLKPKNGDAVILCGAGDETTAKLGALSAALTLL